MDGPSAQYLNPIAGIDAAMWVPPSRWQLFWVRRAPALFAPDLGTGCGLARWWVIATVTPATNVTGLNLGYQSYLNHVFHRTLLARVGHAVCMPFIVAALLALLYPVHAILPCALALAAWWAYWAVKERDPVWGVCAVGLAAALYPLALAIGRLGAADPPRLAQPWVLLLLAGLLQAGSHALEPLPPRVTRSVHWIPPAEYLLGRPGHRALSARAIATGNPALDYIGTGGPTPLRAPL